MPIDRHPREENRMRALGAIFALVAIVAAGSTPGCGKKGTGSGASSTARRDTIPLPAEPFLSPAPETGTPGGHIVVTELAPPKTFNYIVANEQSSTDVDTQLFDGLVSYNAVTQTTAPALAKSWELSGDSLAWTFHLRRGIRFSDGVPITSADFAFMFRVVMDTTISTPSHESFFIDGKPVVIETPDDSTVIFHCPEKYGQFADLVAGNIYCMPKHILEPFYKKSAAAFQSAYGVDTPPAQIVTSGPFRVKQYVTGEKLVFEPNPYYYVVDKAGTRLPYLDEIIYSFVPDQDAELLRFQGGEADLLENPRSVDYATLQKGAKGYSVTDVGVSFNTNFLWFNLNTKHGTRIPYMAPYKYAWFNNQGFRQAISYALNRDAMIKNAFYGVGTPNWGPSTAGNKRWHNSNIPTYDYNPEKAKATLAALGMKDRNGDGVLEDTQGHPVEFSMQTNAENTMRKQMLTDVQSDLAAVGIKVTPQPIAFNELIAHAQSTFQYDTILLGLTGGVPPDPSLGVNVWKSSGMTHFWHVNQPVPGTPWEAKIDKLMDELAVSFDQTRRKAIWDEIQSTISEQSVFVYLPSQKAFVAIRDGFGNVQPTPVPPRVTWDARSLYVKKGGKS